MKAAALNGAQVTSLVTIVSQAQAGTIPRDSALAILMTSFGLAQPDAEKILGAPGAAPNPKVGGAT